MSLRLPRPLLALGLAASLALGVASSALACPTGDVARATTPAPPRDERFRAEVDELTGAAPSSVDVLAVGDSLVRMWPNQQLEGVFPGRTVFRFGVSGDRTQNVLWRLSLPEIRRLRPETVVLLIGTNNLEDGDPACAILAGIAAIVRLLDEGGRRPDLRIVQVLPRGEGFAFRNAERRALNEGIRNLVGRRGNAVAIDVDREITCGMRRICDTYRADALHLEDAGYLILSAALRRN